ncbi:hypothetical protein ACQZ6V_10530 [Agrobacterium sp. 22-3674b3]|jgi:hypothetical protein|uniref:hypothetical protein n=1 Tax=Agrobacterium tumefaciens TaxID=358 RepID=UPI000DD03589|nr:hypothetical protein [Agrobacterium tumefaciens]NTA42674.1 hypothetical protein [Agrobacterium tumefaciens]NTA79547.1 hypothetical protein [Agrobacterium tumefaciens]NTD84261.1 hypothetical protein [Agrobacterium tumefaciens]NTD94577.1 hypothetical protein [Agrobacterium tumefaciens]NTD96029.1 hypothetical protein [Agrobacterium tumefaciens]
MRHTDKLGGRKLPSPVMLAQCIQRGMGRTQIADHYGAGVKRVTERCRELGLTAPLYGKTWNEARFDFTTVVIRRFGSSITLPCPSMYAKILESRQCR